MRTWKLILHGIILQSFNFRGQNYFSIRITGDKAIQTYNGNLAIILTSTFEIPSVLHSEYHFSSMQHILCAAFRISPVQYYEKPQCSILDNTHPLHSILNSLIYMWSIMNGYTRWYTQIYVFFILCLRCLSTHFLLIICYLFWQISFFVCWLHALGGRPAWTA